MTSRSDSDGNEELTRKRKKGVRKPTKHQIQKNRRLQGMEYVSTRTGKTIPARGNLADCSCARKCTQEFSRSDRDEILKHLLSGRSKNEQDTFLMGLIECAPALRRRTKSATPLTRNNIFRYFIMKSVDRIRVCKNAFSILYDIKNKALFRLTTLLSNAKSPNDFRGKHGNRGNAIPPSLLRTIDDHIASFPCKESHYCSKLIKYLAADLDIKTLHELFCRKYPELAGRVKYDFFRNHYNQNHGYRFGRPQIDVCSTCEELETKIKSPHLHDNAKRVAVAEKVVHLRRAKKFYSKQREVAELCSTNSDVGAIVFDYMQNLPLPKMPVQEIFYLRKVWLYVFCVHDLKTKSAEFFVYPEGEAKRGPDEVCSMIWLKIQKMSPEIKELHVFSDAAGGQNRNNTLVRFFMGLIATGRFRKIHQYFPIRGHSFLQCDRNFGTAKRKIRRKDRIYTPDEYVELIATAKRNKYNVTQVNRENILDFKNWWPKYYKRTSISQDKSTKFSISKYRHIVYSAPVGYVTVSDFIDGVIKHTFLLRKPIRNNETEYLPTQHAYSTNIPINFKKINDLRKLLGYIPDEHKPFYDELLARPTTGQTIDSESEEDT